MLERDLFGEIVRPSKASILATRFGVPPFSVLNAREGDWQERKRRWLALGIQSEVGCGENLLKMSDTVLAATARAKPLCFNTGDWLQKNGNIEGARAARREAEGLPAEDEGSPLATGTSIFDPVLCELAYRWWCPAGGRILDPFAGGSVRGIVASTLGFRYTGIDLRAEQVMANRDQAIQICDEPFPDWHCGDSRYARDIAPGPYDFIFSCPPYGDLEQYSTDPRDLSAMAHEEFLESYREIIVGAVAMLAPDRFACFVVGDFRDKAGNYRNFVGETIRAFIDAGMALYNEAILVTSVGSLPIRVTKQFEVSRKLGKTHQNVLVFVKGDPRKCAPLTSGGFDAE